MRNNSVTQIFFKKTEKLIEIVYSKGGKVVYLNCC